MPDLACSNSTSPKPATSQLCELETINLKPRRTPREQRSNSVAGTTVIVHEHAFTKEGVLVPLHLKFSVSGLLGLFHQGLPTNIPN